MDAYPRPVIDVLETIYHEDLPADKDEYRTKILDGVIKALRLNSAHFVLADDSSQFTDFMVREIDEIWVQRYKQHYNKLDPFELFEQGYQGKLIISLKDLVSFSSFLKSEYYHDFLLPQKIHHKIISYLVCGKKVLGLIGFFRSRGSPGFSDEEIRMISTMSPFIARGLEDVNLRCRERLQSDLLEIQAWDSPRGLLILDHAFKPIFINEHARKVCADLDERTSCGIGKRTPVVPTILLEGCRTLKDGLEGRSASNGIKSVSRVIKSQKSGKSYEICTKVLEKEIYPGSCRPYAVAIEKIGVKIEEERLSDLYGLTRREADILTQISRGLKNTDIARELCICEITVKKHVQRLFEKVGVNSRTALIHKTMIEPCSPDQT